MFPFFAPAHEGERTAPLIPYLAFTSAAKFMPIRREVGLALYMRLLPSAPLQHLIMSTQKWKIMAAPR